MYDRFEDFGEDYSYMFSNPDLGDVKSWVDCQSSWWKHQVYGRHQKCPITIDLMSIAESFDNTIDIGQYPRGIQNSWFSC